MQIGKFEELPKGLRYAEIRPYWRSLYRKNPQLKIKRIMDVVLAVFLLILLALPMIVIAIMIMVDSPGGCFFRQVRVTAGGRLFRIHKFRTMTRDADKKGSAVTVDGDARVTKVGAFLRKYRLDELPQLLDVLAGDMSFVGTRPEVLPYVRKYTKEMRATLLLPAGITSRCSIEYKDEARLLKNAKDPDRVYVEKILPEKMRINLEEIRNFSIKNDIKTMLDTVLAVFADRG